MTEVVSFKEGNVTKYSTPKKNHIRKFHFYHLIYFIALIICILITFWVFNRCIPPKDELSETIALGSIFATFGSAIVAIFSILLSRYYERFCNNINILFTELYTEKKWYRWPFIKRESHSVLFNDEITYQVLENATFNFNVGSHILTISLPTIREDFYDLSNWKSYIMMLKESKNYESHVLSKIKQPAIPLLIWDCVLDNYRSIAIYKIARLAVITGCFFILTSIFFAFFYLKLPH